MNSVRSLLSALLSAVRAFIINAMLLGLVLLAGLFTLLAQMMHFARLIAAVVAKVLIVALLICTTFDAAYQVWLAYGADIPALILAALLIVTMAGLGLTGRNWGALLLGGLTALVIGTVIGSMDITTRSLIVVGALAITIAQNQFTQEDEDV